MKTYEGESLVKDYSKMFCLNIKNTLKELRNLGVTIRCEELEDVKRILKAKEQQRKKKRDKRKQKAFDKEHLEGYDHTFAFIASYTEGGAPYGLTYEEMEETDEIEELDCPL